MSLKRLRIRSKDYYNTYIIVFNIQYILYNSIYNMHNMYCVCTIVFNQFKIEVQVKNNNYKEIIQISVLNINSNCVLIVI